MSEDIAACYQLTLGQRGAPECSDAPPYPHGSFRMEARTPSVGNTQLAGAQHQRKRGKGKGRRLEEFVGRRKKRKKL